MDDERKLPHELDTKLQLILTGLFAVIIGITVANLGGGIGGFILGTILGLIPAFFIAVILTPVILFFLIAFYDPKGFFLYIILPILIIVGIILLIVGLWGVGA